MIVLFTDFGAQSPYVGLMKRVLAQTTPEVPIIDLLHEAPSFDAQAAAYLLAAYAPEFPHNSVFVAVVDPGVGSARDGLIVHCDKRFYVGPDNGLFDCVMARGKSRTWRISWRPERLSATFHGRDLFAPIAAQLARGHARPEQWGEPIRPTLNNWPDDLARIVYIDRYGNAMTGIRASSMGHAALRVQGQVLQRARTFSDVSEGAGFCYENSSGLLEIAVNQGSAAAQLGLSVGSVVEVIGRPLTRIKPA